MSLMEKFSAVEIKADNRISEDDKASRKPLIRLGWRSRRLLRRWPQPKQSRPES